MPSRRLLSLLLPPLVVMALIFLLSAQPDDTPDRGFWEVLIRKLGHVTEFFVLTLALCRAIDGLRPRGSVFAVLAGAAVSLIYAGSDEFHQSFVDGRNGTPLDVLIDSVGIALACRFANAQARRRRRTVGPSRPRAA
jgi:VanZ like protein